ncbi:methylated-DNA--[protein]-cysteine S-methyltransferase [Raineyella sp. LH-20]|uniref:methylated-DNA--[protein]-cysteine S-methyltransferase n=1 Tax=Raineyella sp. LH-20 TaxID=3081204 RepID=UPI002953FDD3|nr:methylated-DNA--[protein]-cysteine S-methyltransferase [Raineyella sp. LH-20]WOP20009.1 methylated-DNA--[protein]-cysteine S-methyltransferase [Raineyella sp. LH-20]
MDGLRWTEIATPFGGFVVAWTGNEQPVVRAAGFASVTEVLSRLPASGQHAPRRTSASDLPRSLTARGVSTLPVIRDDGASVVRSAVLAHLDGDREAYDRLQVDQPGPDFHHACWEAIRETRFGERLSYGQVARAAGAPRGARAAANACAATRVSWIIPVHRVIMADGSLGGYGGREDLKEALLDWEASLL